MIFFFGFIFYVGCEVSVSNGFGVIFNVVI